MLNKKVLLMALLPFAANAWQLSNYSAVAKAIKDAEKLHVAIDFNRCVPKFKINASLSPSEVIVTERGVAFALSHLTMDNPMFPGEATLEQSRYTLDKEDRFSMKVVQLNPGNYQPKTQPLTIHCKMGEGVRFYTH